MNKQIHTEIWLDRDSQMDLGKCDKNIFYVSVADNLGIYILGRLDSLISYFCYHPCYLIPWMLVTAFLKKIVNFYSLEHYLWNSLRFVYRVCLPESISVCSCQPEITLNQRSANFCCKGPESKYFRLWAIQALSQWLNSAIVEWKDLWTVCKQMSVTVHQWNFVGDWNSNIM